MELDSLSIEQFKGLGYVIVTLAPQNAKDIQLVGLFGGVMPITKSDTTLVSKEDMYVCVIKGTVIHFLSSLFYQVTQIDIGGLKENGPDLPAVTLMTTVGTKEQTEILSVLKKIHDALREEKRVTEFDVISDETYVGLTDIQKRTISTEGPSGNTNKNLSRSGGTSEDYSTHHNPNACGYGAGWNGTTYKAKTITTATFARAKKPEQAELDEMAAKLKAIREGTYEPPALPTIPADKVKEKKKEDEKKVTNATENTETHSQEAQSSLADDDDLMPYNSFACG